MKKFSARNLSYTQFIAFGFLLIIFAGTLLLCLPISSRSGEWTNPLNALFTATSATCVTGLVVYDTYTHWSLFGQTVILLLIQIGGLGFMAVITMFSIFAKRKISLHERKLLVQTSGSMRYQGIVVLIGRILKGTFLFEGLGAAVLAIRFCQEMPFWEGIYNAVFHSVSAFCNAGFDLMGKNALYSSFVDYSDDWLVCLTLIALIIIGGIGFLVWNDVRKHKFDFRHYELHSKLVLCTSGALIVSGFFYFLVAERNGLMADMDAGERILTSLFLSVSPRTAGFNTLDQNGLSQAGRLMTMILMFIGGSPGSTAGGIKTTTFLVVILSALSSARNVKDVTVFKRRIDGKVIREACSIVTIYFAMLLLSVAVIAVVEPYPLESIFFEAVSAIGTVGLSCGLSQGLSAASKIIFILLMFFGRIGGLSFVLVVAEQRKPVAIERPAEKILIG